MNLWDWIFLLVFVSLSEPAIEDPDIVYFFKELLAKTVVTSADLGAIICSRGPSDRMNVLGTSDLKVLANEEVRRIQLVTTVTGQILNSLSSTGKVNIPNEAKGQESLFFFLLIDLTSWIDSSLF